jgi:predicted DsbA family dithiol-disulfide isomerase
MQIDVWSDFACPWCALGLRRLHVARQQFGHDDEITVVHRAFELDPHAPPRRRQTMNELLATKYGMSPEQVQAGHDRLAALGRDVGFEFNFDRIQSGNTFDAHRLASAVRGTAIEDAVVTGLFGAYFTDGELLSDHEVLVRVAKAAGMDPGEARRSLTGDARASEVRADEALARELGINGVPHFVINGKWAIPGAQDVDTMVLALERAWERTGHRESGHRESGHRESGHGESEGVQKAGAQAT